MADLLTTLSAILGGPAQAAPAGAGNIPPFPFPRPSTPPLPERKPEALRPETFALPNPLSNFDPHTGQFRGGPAAAAAPAPAPASAAQADAGPGFFDRLRNGPGNSDPIINAIRENVPGVEWLRRLLHGEPAPVVASANAAPAMSSPAADTPPLPVRRPGLPKVPGIVVDNAPNAGGNDLISEMRTMFAGAPIAQGTTGPRAFTMTTPAQGTPQPDIPPAQSSPTASPAHTAAIGGWQTTVTPEQSGPTVTGRDVAQFFRNLFRGAAVADPRAPGFTAFSQGAAGAMVGRRQEEQEDSAAALKAEERQFERDYKTAEMRRAEAKDLREARRAEIDNAKTVTEIIRNLGGDLTTDQKLRLENAVTNYARAINPAGTMTEEELRPKLEAYRDQLVKNITGQGQGGGQGRFREGQTATGPNGEKIVFRNGRWQPLS